MPTTYKCPKCENRVTPLLPITAPPTCSTHVGKKPTVMKVVEEVKKPRGGRR